MTRHAALLVLVAPLAACINDDNHFYEVTLAGEVMVATGASSGTLHLELHHAWTGRGPLRTPLGLVDATELEAVGPIAWTALIPVDVGEGLVLYGWLDRDEDGLLCGRDAAPEPAGVVELAGFPAHALDFSLVLAADCAAPTALFPP